MSNVIKFYLNEKRIDFPCSLRLFKKIPDDKSDLFDILFNQHEYTVQSPVKMEVFNQFLDYWKEEKNPKVDLKNILEFYFLSKEFGIMKAFLETPYFQNLLEISYLVTPNIFDQTCDRSQIEAKIASHLNEYLASSQSELSQIPIGSLFNIFNHPSRNIESQDEAYKFIVQNGKEKDENFFILLSTLDGDHIDSPDIRKEALLKSKDHFGFLPQNIIPENDLPQIIELNKSLSKSNEELQNENMKLKSDNDMLTAKNIQLEEDNKDSAVIIQRLEDINDHIKEDNQSMKNQENSLLAAMTEKNQQLEDENKKLNENIENLNNEKNDLANENEMLKKQINIKNGPFFYKIFSDKVLPLGIGSFGESFLNLLANSMFEKVATDLVQVFG